MGPQRERVGRGSVVELHERAEDVVSVFCHDPFLLIKMLSVYYGLFHVPGSAGGVPGNTRCNYEKVIIREDSHLFPEFHTRELFRHNSIINRYRGSAIGKCYRIIPSHIC